MMGMAGGVLRMLGVKIGYNNAGANAALRETDREVDKVKRNSVQLGQQFDRMGRQMQRTGAYMMTRITLPIVAFAGASLRAASNAEEMQSKFNTVFGNMARETQAWAETTAKSIGRSRFEMMGYLADTQNMLVGMGASREEGAELSKQITQLAVDLASFNNVAESDAIASLQSAMIGNHMAARSLGAVINDNTLALAMERMQITGKFQDLDELQKMQVRYTAILMQSEDAIGDAERTSGSFANQMRGLKADIGDLGVTIGTILLPYATEMINWARNGIELFSGLDESTQQTAIQMAGFAAAMGPVLMIGGTLARSIFYMSKVYTMVKGAMLGAVIAKGSLLAAFGPTVLVVAGITTALIALYQNWDKVTAAIGRAKEAVLGWNNTNRSMGGYSGVGAEAREAAMNMGTTRTSESAGVETKEAARNSRARDSQVVSNNNTSTYAPTIQVKVEGGGSAVDNMASIRKAVEQQLEPALANHYRRSYSSLPTNTAR